jgi:hypothetical protein
MEAMSSILSAWQDLGNIDLRIEAAMAKYFATESLWKISDVTLQLRGGRGYEKARSLKARGEPPYPVERIMRDNRINLILEGSSEIMKLFLAREAMDSHLKRAGDLLNPRTSIFRKLSSLFKNIGHYSIWYPKQYLRNLFPDKYPQAKELEPFFSYISKTSRRLARSIFGNMARYRQNLEKKQLILGRLMDIGTELFAMTCTVSYAVYLIKKNPQDRTPIQLATYFCEGAQKKIEESFLAISQNKDKEAVQIAENVLDEKMVWLEKGVIPIEE